MFALPSETMLAFGPRPASPMWIVICGNEKSCEITMSERPYEAAREKAKAGSGLGRRAFVLSGRYDSTDLWGRLQRLFKGAHLYDNWFSASVDEVQRGTERVSLHWKHVRV